MTERIQPSNRPDSQPDSQSDTEQTTQPTDLNESAAPSPIEQAPTVDTSPIGPAVEAVTSMQTSTPQAGVESSNESSKEPEPGEPAEPVEQPTAASSDEPASPIPEEPVQTEQPTEKVQVAEATPEDAVLTPVGVPAPAAAPTASAELVVDPQEAMGAAKWGRADGEGRVYVQDGGVECEVGQLPDAPVVEAMAFYVRRYLNLKATIDLFATRLPQFGVREIDSTLSSISESLTEPAAIGDLEGLQARSAALKTVIAERREAAPAERVAAKEQALKERTVIVERTETIAEQDPARTQWKSSGAELRELLESWKATQRRGPRLDHPTEDGLWKRFSHARTTFDRCRRQFFNELDTKQTQVRAAKEALIKRAEEMRTSTDWAGISMKYRDLLAERKKAGRASCKEDGAPWARSRATQQIFYDVRRAKDKVVDAEFVENLKVKEVLATKAGALLPIKDIKAAKKALRPIQDAWEEAGRVPRGTVCRIEGRMCAVEDAIRETENAEWRRIDPETKARVEGLAGQLQDAIAGLEKDPAAAQAAGGAKKVTEAEAALTACRTWFEQVLRSAKT